MQARSTVGQSYSSTNETEKIKYIFVVYLIFLNKKDFDITNAMFFF